MSRQILCWRCGDTYNLDPQDKARGFFLRRCYLVIGKPPLGHGVSLHEFNGLNATLYPMDTVVCDGCSADLTGQVAIAISIWNSEGGSVGLSGWEHEFGEVINRETALAARMLAGKEKE